MDSSERKRKRQAEDSAPKKKRVTIQEPAPSTVVAKVSALVQPKCSPPIIATTPGLCMPESLRFASYSKPAIPSDKRRNATKSQDIVLHSADHHLMDYTGKEDKIPGKEAPLNHYIGVYDPTSRQLRVVEARKMIIRGAVRSQQASAAEMADRGGRQTFSEMKTELGHAFGTKKAKKALLALTENAISPKKNATAADGKPEKLDSSERALMSMLGQATAHMSTKEDLQAAIDLSKPVPRGHFDAEEIQDVYKPEEIIGADILNAVPVRDWQQTVKAGETVSVYSKFVAERVSRVAAHTEAVERLRLLRYLYWLILMSQFAGKGGKGGKGKRVPPKPKLKELLDGAPDVIIDDLRRKFTEDNTMRKFHQDLLMTHCCVFASIIDNYEVDTLHLREDLKLEQPQMSQYFKEIGARIKVTKDKGKTTVLAKLSLPLEFPRQRMGRSK